MSAGWDGKRDRERGAKGKGEGQCNNHYKTFAEAEEKAKAKCSLPNACCRYPVNEAIKAMLFALFR